MSHFEHHTLSTKMEERGMSQLAEGFSKEWEKLEAAYSLWVTQYGFFRRHQALCATPTKEAGLADRACSAERLLS